MQKRKFLGALVLLLVGLTIIMKSRRGKKMEENHMEKRLYMVFTIKDIWTWFDENNIYLNKSNRHEYKVKLMKLTFFAVGIFKGITGKKLVCENFEAWKEGPVSNKAYAQISQNDKSYELEKFNDYPDVVKILNKVNDIFGIYSADALSRTSHLLDSWSKNYKVDGTGTPIPHCCIPDDELDIEFSELVDNLDLFYRIDNTKELACIINDKTIIYNKEDESKFESNYDSILESLCDENFFGEDDLIFIDFEGDKVRYAV